MKNLLITVLVLGIAGGVAAQDTFGLWRLVEGEYVNYLPDWDMPGVFDLYITVHAPSSLSIGGYEVGITDEADFLFALDTSGPNGWTNFGDAFNHLVGFQTPVLVQDEITVLGSMHMLATFSPPGMYWLEYHAADPPSIPGHDGPVYADGTNPDILVACGTVTGWPEVFMFGSVVGTENYSWSGVKSLFD